MENRVAATPVVESKSQLQESGRDSARTDTWQQEPTTRTAEHTAPLFLYRKENKQPYSAKFFNVETYADLVKEPRADIDRIVPKLEFIDTAMEQYFERNGLKNELNTFDTVVQDFFKKIGVTDVDTIERKIGRLYTYLTKEHEYKTKYAELEKLRTEIYGSVSI